MRHSSFVWARLSRSRRATIGIVVLGMLVLAGIFAELLVAQAPIVAIGPSGVNVFPVLTRAELYEGRTRAEIDAIHAGDTALWPIVRADAVTPVEVGPHAPSSLRHPLGTDAHGRDLAARLIYGARNALGLSLVAVLAGMFLGVALGGLAGYYGGFWNDRLARLVETIDTFPAIIVVALVRAIERQPSALSLVLAVAFVRWAEVARLVRAEVLQASVEDYVVAARALAVSPIRIFWSHILRNAMGPVIVSSVFGIASVVLLEVAISFLGMGAPSQVASWGETLAEGAQNPSELRLILLPAFALLAMVGGLYVIADALRDAMDPHTVRRGPKQEPDSPLSVMISR
jgi:peptide/nickel transport system permease protein